MIESPSGGVPEKAPRWDLTRTEACGGGKVFWWMPLMVWEYLGIYSAKIRVGGLPRGPQALKAPPRARLAGLRPPREPYGPSPSPMGSSSPRKIIAKVLFHLDFIWYSFYLKLKNKEKTETVTGSRLIG